MSQFIDLMSLAMATEDEAKQREIIIVALSLLGEAIINMDASLERLAFCVGSVSGSDSGAVFHHREYKI